MSQELPFFLIVAAELLQLVDPVIDGDSFSNELARAGIGNP